MSEASASSVERKEDVAKDESGTVRLWLEAIALADKGEKEWRKKADESLKIYKDAEERRGKRFNILFSNIQTLAPAIYNSPPIPDIRRRYSDTDADAKAVAQCLERAVSFMIDSYDLDSVLSAVCKDGLLQGRGVPRVRYEPTVLDDNTIAFQKATCELVQWDDIRFGPTKTWEKLPWLAIRHYMTKAQLERLSPETGALVDLDTTINGCDDEKAKQTPDLFKRALVWEVWDRDGNEVLFIAASYPHKPLLRGKPDINLTGFFPVPKPFYAVEVTDSIEPIEPYRFYRDQAEELNDITKRITKIIKALRWRGIGTQAVTAALERMKNADDGDIVPAENEFQVMAGQKLDDAIWMMPVDKLIQVLDGLYRQREQVKQIIYEVTGIADILRGSTKATETLGAQQLKAQWGSLRIKDMQKGIVRVSRDIVRMMVEIIAENFEPELLRIMTGITLTPEQVELMRSDPVRLFRIDVETDSTIQADQSQAQKNISDFIGGFGAYIQSVGPAVQSGIFPLPVAVDLLTAFARSFKLGRQAEDALDSLKQSAEVQPQQQAPAQPAPQPMPQQGGMMPVTQPMQQPMRAA